VRHRDFDRGGVALSLLECVLGGLVVAAFLGGMLWAQ
jgi:hypothetical protein